ncbi:MAG: ThuA domain-containing protein [Massiliimalia sp.]|jgi:trehalose utilization protein
MNVTVWNENIDEANGREEVLAVHPHGIHNTVKDIIEELGGDVHVRTATLQEPECGLTDEVLNHTDVLVWWSHQGHDQVPDELVKKIHHRVLAGMGLILLHSSHYSKLLKQILGTTGDLQWRDNTYERLFCINPSHPIAEGIPESFELGTEECYTEYFDIPKPDDVIFLGWFDIGNVFRSGCTWTRGYGKIFYFQPGHETNHSYFNPYVRRIIQNGVRWVCPKVYKEEFGAPHIDVTLEEKRKMAE